MQCAHEANSLNSKLSLSSSLDSYTYRKAHIFNGLSGDPKNNMDVFKIRPALQGIVMATLFSMALLMTAYRPDTQEISFQTFKTELLANGLVERVEVVNKSFVKVYVKTSPPKPESTDDTLIQDEVILDTTKPKKVNPMGQSAAYKFFFHVGSVDSFERQMEVAQQQLGWKPEDHVAIKYATQWSILQEVARFAPTILLIAAYIWFTRQSMGALGGSNSGGRNWFNVGKIQVSYSIFFKLAHQLCHYKLVNIKA